MTAAVYTKYKTRPLENWQKCKELRLQSYQAIGRAKENGRLVVAGSAGAIQILPAGLGDYVYLGGEAYGASIGGDPAFSYPCLEATEAAGYGRDSCVYFRNQLGSLLLDKYYFGGPFPKCDFFIQSHICDAHAKWFQIFSEHTGAPFFCLDMPPGPWQGQRYQEKLDYYVQQLLDCVDWMQKITGRSYDDSRLIPAVINEYEAGRLWAEICLLNQHIPAPLDEKSMLTLYLPSVILRGNPRAVEFYEALLAEVQQRVADGIAAVTTERYRYFHEGIPPWHFLKVFRLLERYGAVGVGSLYVFLLAGGWRFTEKGMWQAPPPFRELGVELKSREDALRFFANRMIGDINLRGSFGIVAEEKSRELLQAFHQWHAQGVVMHLNRGCKGTGGFMLENRLALLKADIPVVTYEGNAGDRRDFDEAQVIDHLESFMESQGLHRLGEE